MGRTVAQAIASAVQARLTCLHNNNVGWIARHGDAVSDLVKEYLPSGSGCDNGTTIDLDKSTEDRLVFGVAYHHMNEGGFYDGWTDYVVTVRPTFFGPAIHIAGRNRNDVKAYLAELFDGALRAELPAESRSPARDEDEDDGRDSDADGRL